MRGSAEEIEMRWEIGLMQNTKNDRLSVVVEGANWDAACEAAEQATGQQVNGDSGGVIPEEEYDFYPLLNYPQD